MEFKIAEKLLGITLLGTEWVLWTLIALSIISIGIVVERFWFFSATKFSMPTFLNALVPLLNDKKYEEAKTLCQGSSSLEAQVVLKGIEAHKRGPTSMEEMMNSYLLSQKQVLDRGLAILATLGNNAPFIGLFGTVLGIIIAFHDLAKNPAGGPSVVMSGISEALIATAVGLIVAIPAVIFNNYFQRVVKKRLQNSESLIRLLVGSES